MVAKAVLMLAGCGSTTGVVALPGTDMYRIYKRGATGFIGSDSITADITLQASRFCAEHGKMLQVVNTLTGHSPYMFGNYPKAEVQFRCVAATP